MSIGVALLVSADPNTIRIFTQALHQLSIAPEVCKDAPNAVRLLSRRKFEAVVVDLELKENSGLVLDELRASSSNRTAVTFAIATRGVAGEADLRKKAGFVIERPLSTMSILATLRPAYGLILRERRRYFRCPVCIPVAIRRNAAAALQCHSVNISEGEMALSTTTALTPGELVTVTFVLPDQHVSLSTDATVCWWKAGRLGLRFGDLPMERKVELQNWLAEKLEELLPPSVAEEFQGRASSHPAASP